MNPKRTYKYLIWLGIIIFIIGVIADGRAMPNLRYGAYIGPILFIAGVFIWIPLRLRNPILHSFSSYENQSFVDTAFGFFMDNFMREFWGFCIAFFMFMLLAGGYGIKQSIGYEAAIYEIKSNVEVKTKIGNFQSIGPILGGSTSTEMLKLGFSIYGSKGSSPIRIELKNENGEWKLISLELD